MTKIIAVIGAGFGDEGKGLMTDYFASQHPNSIIIRYNGGAQAGHTVTTPDGLRHIFSHFGSGTLLNRPTLLSEYFVCNPLIFKKERRELLLKMGDQTPRVLVHQNSIITTPVDMIINQIMEIRRDVVGGRHGSVGLGFNETIERNTYTEFKLTVDDLRQGKEYRDTIINNIRQHWLSKRLPVQENPCDRELELLQSLQNNYLWFDFNNAIDYFLEHIMILDGYSFDDCDTIIFEGAQGLMLDQDYGTFPHVTRSNTGVKNIIEILRHVDDIESVDIQYVSRAYSTRHGHGPLHGETILPYDIVDETNKHHAFQGAIRHAPLSFNILFDAIFHDYDQLLNSNPHQSVYTCNLVFTCLDQIKDVGLCYDYEEDLPEFHTQRTGNEFIDIILEMADYVSYGPTRADIVIHNPHFFVD